VSETIGLRQDGDNDNQAIEEEEEDEDEDEEEEQDEEPTSSLPKNDEINKLTEIITCNHLLTSPN
ncbi:unnamed protein product, partial [Rotaria magnacalcarata]